MTAAVPGAGFWSWTWVRRLRLLAAVALLWAGLHFLVGATFLPRGLNRPVTLAAAHAPVLAALAVAVLLWVAAYVGTFIAGARDRWQGLLIAALGLAAWVAGGGTITDWLMLVPKDGAVGPPSSAAYWPLVAEYVVLALLMAGALASGSLAAPVTGAPEEAGAPTRIRRALAPEAGARERGGLMALLTTTAVIVLLMPVLTGPVVGGTRRGQVYFAIVVSCAAGVLVATRVVKVRHAVWFWPAPILAGLIGVVLAALKPDFLLPAGYNQLNSIPAWGLARPLPMELVGVGVAICLWTLRATTGGSPPERA